MLKGKLVNLQLFREEKDCHRLLEAYNDLSQRAVTDHTEIKHPQTLCDMPGLSVTESDSGFAHHIKTFGRVTLYL